MNNKQIEELVNLMFDTDMEEVMKEKNTLEYIHKLQQENKQLKELTDKYEEEHRTTFETWLKGQKVLIELEKWLNENESLDDYCNETTFTSVLDKIQKLKEKYK